MPITTSDGHWRDPHLLRGPWPREEQVVWIPHAELSRTLASPQRTPTPPKPSLLVQELEVIPPMMPAHSFLGLMACLKKDESPERAPKASPSPLAIEVVPVPRLVTMCTSHIVRDEMTGVTCMDTVTTSVGRMALSGPEQETSSQGP